jgi:adenine-specific DNA-methyltransferase
MAGFETIAELGKERIRRVVARMKEQTEGTFDTANGEGAPDLGFRVYKLAPSNYRQWSPPEGIDAEAWAAQMELFADGFADGWTPEAVIAEVALKEAGFELNYRVEDASEVDKHHVYRVTSPDDGRRFYLCLDDKVCLAALKPLKLDKDTLFVCRGSALDDEVAANLAMQCRLRVIPRQGEAV